jgi:TetR/AcrR family transcriptional regulator, regulator of cefoperazone and chloramphenicol sensitivity
MRAASRKTAPSARRAPRPDGDATRQHLLETAGQVFAERGFAQVTSKEICANAGTPLASINYHFGSRDGLYEAVLVEAHRQLVDVEDLMQVAQASGDAKRKLRALLSRLIGMSTGAATPWGFRVLLREMMSPSSAMPMLVEKAIRPKATLLLGLVGEVLGLPPTHPAVQRALAFSVLPSLVILIAPSEVSTRLIPGIARGGEGLEEELLRYVMAGLDAVGRAHRPKAPRGRAA